MKNFTKDEIKDAFRSAGISVPAVITFRSTYKLLKERNSDDTKYTVSTAKIVKFLLALGFDYREFINCNRNGIFDFFRLNVSVENENNEKNILDKVADTIPISLMHVKNSGENFTDADMPATLEQAEKFLCRLKESDRIEVIQQNICSGLFDISSDNKIFFTKNNSSYAGVDVTKSDNIWLQFDIPVNTRFFMITEVENGYPSKLSVLGTFLYLNQCYYLEAESKNINIDFSSANRTYMLIFANETMTRFYSVEIEIISEELEKDSEHCLCIDFGTSNTTVGTWLRGADGKDNITLVSFDDVTETNKSESHLFPTVVYIKSAVIGSDRKPAQVTMLFGYEAKKHMIENGYDVKGSMFYNIKQWIVNDENYEVECKDENDQVFRLSAHEIIACYIRKVIQLAEIKLKRKFVKFHFSAPVRLKSKFNTIVNKILPAPEYTVIPVSKSLDEGIAIIYERISELRVEFEAKQNENLEGNVTIIDCGGGTTDVASCKYEFKKTDTGTKVRITTRFENGQNNFGGNDITYRIFQLLKVKLRNYYVRGTDIENINLSTEELMKSETDDYLGYVDECIKDGKKFEYYNKLDAVSKEAEWVIPTDFGNREIVEGNNMVRWANRNFNYLWQLAERLKIEFFSNDKMASFYSKRDEIIKADTSSMYFWVDTTGAEVNRKLKLEKRTDIPDIEINIKELAALLSPQIYYILSVIMKSPEDSGLMNSRIRLSGQSCKISLFRDLLKEFVPGKYTRSGKPKSENAEQMKIACVKGCIQYMMEQEFGAAVTYIETAPPKILYSVTVDKGNSQSSMTLLDGLQIGIKNGRKSMWGKLPICRRIFGEGSIRFTVYNKAFGYPVEEYTDSVKIGSITDKGITDMNEIITRIKNTSLSDLAEYTCKTEGIEESVLDRLMRDMQNEPTDSVGKLLVFAVPNNDGCGFILWQIVKQETDGKRVFHIVGETPLYYQKTEVIKSRYDGRNCID